MRRSSSVSSTSENGIEVWSETRDADVVSGIVTLDLGTDESRAAAAEKAKSLGIEAIFEAHKDGTGFVLLP